MVDLLRKIYHRLSKFEIVQFACRLYTNGFPIGDYMAYLRLKKLKKKKRHHEKIRVVFLCQSAAVWNKLQSVFEKMLMDSRFEPILLAIPEKIQDADLNTYNYFYDLYGNIVMNSWLEGSWLDLKTLEPDYVFYQRPYDQYLPPEYRSNIVSGYAKVCHVVYGYLLSVTNEHSVLNKRFFRNVYMYFAENKIYHDFNMKRFRISHKKGVRKTLNIGYPALETFMKSREDKVASDFNVLWTPRWTEDKECGGSNFINFKDKILELPRECSNISLTFRPHPMTFEHFISVGRITRQEVNEYLAQYDNSKMIYDNEGSYERTFWNSDVLLTDISSIIVEYFLTGKPIIYCDTGAVPNKIYEEMMKTFYVVKTWEEAKAIVLKLEKGIDPLKNERKNKISELMGEDFENISDRFLQEIYLDYNNLGDCETHM